MQGVDTGGGLPMMRARALIIACHPLPCLAVTAMATLLTAEAAPPGFAAGRIDKQAAAGLISVRALRLAAGGALAAGGEALTAGPHFGGSFG